ncbi:MAG TPA: lamin tail domain-containing protein [Egibacteraceae bacterium]|nr:lamin tail domain-containing protein [Egibacteraceae bacterium]
MNAMSFGAALRRRAATAATLTVAVAAALLVTAPPAFAEYKTRAFVTRVLDGDTIEVDTNRDGKTDQTIRFIGVDTNEKNQCGYAAATRLQKRLLQGRWVTLATDVKNAVGQVEDGEGKARPLRRVYVKRNGKQIDATAHVLAAGLGLFRGDDTQPTRMPRYHATSYKAAIAGKGIFKGDMCGTKFSPGAKFQVDLQWSDSVKGRKLYDEHVRITNVGTAPANFKNWVIRPGGKRYFRVPTVDAAGRSLGTLAPGETMRIWVGHGTQSRLERYLGSQWSNNKVGQLWPDIDVFKKSTWGQKGDGVYLLDPKRNVRGFQMYGCRARCGNPAIGKLEVKGNPGKGGLGPADEWVRIRNIHTAAVRVDRFVVDVANFSVPLTEGAPLSLNPGESMYVRMGHGTTTSHEIFLNNGGSQGVIPNGGGQAVLRTYPGVKIGCNSWGSGSCTVR